MAPSREPRRTDALDHETGALVSVVARLNRMNTILLSSLEVPRTFRQYRTLTRVAGGCTGRASQPFPAVEAAARREAASSLHRVTAAAMDAQVGAHLERAPGSFRPQTTRLHAGQPRAQRARAYLAALNDAHAGVPLEHRAAISEVRSAA